MANTTLTDGSPVPADGSHKRLKPNGQQEGYVVLSEEERAKGFVRPVRRSYVHVGPPGPEFPLRDLTPEQAERYADAGYVKYEAYPPERGPAVGRYWTQADLNAIGRGCNTLTTMGQALAETFARDNTFYSVTFCCRCKKHLPLNEFIWERSEEVVGS